MSAVKTLAIALLLTLPLAANAQDLAKGDAIKAAVSGNTVQGSMTESGVYTEFYAADGTIKAADYSGTWTVEGDTMCFSYGDAPDCWNVRIEGEMITWVQDGVDGGTGTVIPGNPNEY